MAMLYHSYEDYAEMSEMRAFVNGAERVIRRSQAACARYACAALFNARPDGYMRVHDGSAMPLRAA